MHQPGGLATQHPAREHVVVPAGAGVTQMYRRGVDRPRGEHPQPDHAAAATGGPLDASAGRGQQQVQSGVIAARQPKHAGVCAHHQGCGNTVGSHYRTRPGRTADHPSIAQDAVCPRGSAGRTAQLPGERADGGH